MIVGGRKIALVDRGSGPPVVLLHASGLGAQQWGPFAPKLAERHRVLAPDLLGYGGSAPWPDRDEFDLEADLAVVRAVVAHAGAPVHLVGHSYGGLLALCAAHDAAVSGDGTVRSLLVYEPVAFGVLAGRDPDGVADLAAADDGTLFDLRTGGDERWVSRFIDWWGGAGAWSRLPPARQAALVSVGRKSFLEVRALMRLARTADEWRVPCPTLVMSGTRSPRAAQGVCRILAETLPGARAHVLEGAGHMGPLEDARRFWKMLEAWLAERA